MQKAQEKTKPSLENLSFEQALKELETIVRALENGTGGLDESINAYLHGTELKEFCLRKLSEARLKVEQIVQVQNNGQDALALKPLDVK